MWVELSKVEVAEILNVIRPGTITEKLTATPHSEAEAFRDAANTDDYTHVPIDAPVDRTRNGAYVLSWRWVYNQSAGFLELTDFGEYSLTESTRERLEALRQFQVDYIDAESNDECLGEGKVDRAKWILNLVGDVLIFGVITADLWERHLWSTSTSPVEDPTLDALFLFIADSVDRYRAELA